MTTSYYRHILRRMADELDGGDEGWIINQRSPSYIRTRVTDKWPGTTVRTFDSSYWCCIKPHVEQFLKNTYADEQQYQSDVHDCDDFARHLWALATLHGVTGVGFAVNPRHAFNIAVFPGPKQPAVIEPQTGEFVTADGKHSMDDAEVIF